MSHGLLIDLVTVASYEVAGRKVVVPQREEPDRSVRAEPSAAANTSALPVRTSGQGAGLRRLPRARREGAGDLPSGARPVRRLGAAGVRRRARRRPHLIQAERRHRVAALSPVGRGGSVVALALRSVRSRSFSARRPAHGRGPGVPTPVVPSKEASRQPHLDEPPGDGDDSADRDLALVRIPETHGGVPADVGAVPARDRDKRHERRQCPVDRAVEVCRSPMDDAQ